MATYINKSSKIKKLNKQLENEFESICSVSAKQQAEYFNSIITEMCNTPFVIDCMLKLKKYDEATYLHSLRVGLYCMLIGYIMKLDNEFIKELGTAGLLHDIGKKFIPKEIINKQGKLDNLEMNVIQAHVANSTFYIKQKYNFKNENILLGVYQHHERLDGSGYPRHLISEEISVPGRIIAIADVLEAYSSKRSYHEGRTIKQTMKFLNKAEGLDKNIISKLSKQIDLTIEKVVI